MYAVCSSHPVVLETALLQAAADGSELLIEATCNQVNQDGGYTGMSPAGFVDYVRGLARKTGFSEDRLFIGGDHLGPHAWRNETAAPAMEKAQKLVRDCVAAGYAKIHLDAGMPLADDDSGSLPMELSAARAALLCRAAENARSERWRNTDWPVYVIGAEAPTPGGSLENGVQVPVTAPEAVADFLEICRRHFFRAGLEDAWQRVTAMVVQPGVDFGNRCFAPYDGEKCAALSRCHDQLPHRMTFEIHGTDFQSPDALTRMVTDHFALLKTGPALTFAFREAVFGLARIESEWLGDRKGVVISDFRRVIDDQMLKTPKYWKSHFTETGPDAAWQRAFGFLDRIRYYWTYSAVESALSRLIANLSDPIPLPLISQYLPESYAAVVSGALANDPMSMIRHRIRSALLPYVRSCRMGS